MFSQCLWLPVTISSISVSVVWLGNNQCSKLTPTKFIKKRYQSARVADGRFIVISQCNITASEHKLMMCIIGILLQNLSLFHAYFFQFLITWTPVVWS